MQQLSKFGSIILFFILVVSRAAYAQTGDLYGTIYTSSPPHSALPGLRIFLRSDRTGEIGPSITDNYGRFAFYNIPRGTYTISILAPDGRRRLLTRDNVQVPGREIDISLIII